MKKPILEGKKIGITIPNKPKGRGRGRGKAFEEPGELNVFN